jgi:hypothetical protein
MPEILTGLAINNDLMTRLAVKVDRFWGSVVGAGGDRVNDCQGGVQERGVHLLLRVLQVVGLLNDQEADGNFDLPSGFRSVSDCLNEHFVGSQHEADQQQREDDRPGELRGRKREAEHGRQYHRGEPEDGVPLEQVFLFGAVHEIGFCVGSWRASRDIIVSSRHDNNHAEAIRIATG